jgi:hypothetical protein
MSKDAKSVLFNTLINRANRRHLNGAP